MAVTNIADWNRMQENGVPFEPHLDMCFCGRTVAAERQLYLVPVAIYIKESVETPLLTS